eukprot:7426405-Karenia_brevis.AAC.1
MNFLGMGDVEGDGSKRLVIARQNRNHFVPLIPCWSHHSGSVSRLASSSNVSASSSSSLLASHFFGEAGGSVKKPLKCRRHPGNAVETCQECQQYVDAMDSFAAGQQEVGQVQK